MKAKKWLVGDCAGWIAGLMLAFLVCVAVGAVFFRYVAGAPLSWAEEMETLTMLWIIMVGGIYAQRNGTLLRMDLLYNLLPRSAQRISDIIHEVVLSAMFGVMAWFGWKLALQVGDKTLPLLGVKLFWLYLSLPVGAAGMLLMTLVRLYGRLTGQTGERADVQGASPAEGQEN